MRSFRGYPYFHVLAISVFAAAVFVATLPGESVAAPTIRLKANGLDRFKFHGRVKLDPPALGGPVDPMVDGFGVELRNDFGTIYEAELFHGDFQPRKNLRFRFRDRAAKNGSGTRNGLFQVITRFREYAGVWYYTVRVLAYDDLSAATEPRMTVFFDQVNGTASVTADWERKQYGWRLPLARF